MNKYIKLDDAIEAVTSIFRVYALFGGINDNEDLWREKAEKVFAKCEVTDTAKQGLEYIEVSEDCISREYILSFLEGEVMGDDDYIAGMNDEQREIREVVRNAPSVVPSKGSDK